MGFNKTVNLTLGENRTDIIAMIINDNTFEILHEVYDIQMELVEQSAMICILDGWDKYAIHVRDDESWFFIGLLAKD